MTTSIGISSAMCAFKRVRSFLKSYRDVRTMGPCCDIDKAIDLVFTSDGGFLQPVQRPAEIRVLLAILSERKPAVIVEIGSASGGNLFLFTRVAANNALIVSIDLPGGRFGGGYRRWRIPLYRAFARPHQTVHLIRGNSHAPETVAKLSAILRGRKIDFLFVDGDHTYQGVSQDFKLYHPFVHPGGIIAFHDIAEDSPKTQCNVNRFWQQIKTRFNHMEIVEDWKGRFGIGLITCEPMIGQSAMIPGSGLESMQAFFDVSTSACGRVSRLTAVIVTYNNPEMLEDLLKDLGRQTMRLHEIIVMDNSDSPATQMMVSQKFPSVTCVKMSENVGTAGGFHEGIRQAVRDCEFVLTLDDDVRMCADSVEKLYQGYMNLQEENRCLARSGQWVPAMAALFPAGWITLLGEEL